MSSPFWADPADIKFKISPHHDLAGTQGGDWDIERRFPLTDAVKHQAICRRYAEGLPWEETDLFRVTYRRRFECGGTIRGEASLKGLLAQYYSRVDDLFASMEREGFQIGHKTPLPVLLIGRGGEVFIGNQGNHRLAIAQVLGLTRFAGRILCRHPQSPR